MARNTQAAATNLSGLTRDSLELASLASSGHSGRSSIGSNLSGTAPNSTKLSFEEQASSDGGPRNAHRSFSVSSAFDFAANLFPLSSTSGAGYTALGAPGSVATDNVNGGLEKHKSLTFTNGLSLVIGLMVGSGIFSSPSQVNRNAGSPGAALLVWSIAGILAWTGAASYAELGGAIPLSGGATVYLSKIYGEWAGFLFTWVAVTVLKPGSAAIICIIFGEYVMDSIVGTSSHVNPWISKAVALSCMLAVSFLNCASTRIATLSINVFMFLKFVILFGVAAIGIVVAITGLSYAPGSNLDIKSIDWFGNTSHDLSKWAVALYAGLWAYDGWDNTNYVTGEFVNARRDLPRTIHTSLVVVIFAFLTANVSYILVLPDAIINSSNTIGIVFGRQIFGSLGALIFAAAVSMSCYGSIAATTFTSSRLIYAAARDGLIPPWFGRLGLGTTAAVRLPLKTSQMSRIVRWFGDDVGFFYTPIMATVLNATLTIIYIVVGDFVTLTTFYGVAGYTFYFFTVLGLIILRVREPALERPYRCWITTPIIFCAVSIFLLSRAVFAEPKQTAIVFGFILGGVPLYLLRTYLMKGRRGLVESSGSLGGWKRFSFR